jgi:hypothetical protein
MFKSVRSLSEGVASNIAYALLVAAGGTVLALLKHFVPNLFTLVLWGLVGAALVAVILAAWAVLTRIPKRLPETTPENVESNIRAWLDTFQITTQRITEVNGIFALLVTLASGMKIVIMRPRLYDKYIQMESATRMSDHDKKRFEALPPEEQNIFGAAFSVELARTGMGFTMDLLSNNIVLSRRIPITPNLNEGSFMEALEALDQAKIGTHRMLTLMLINLKRKLEKQEQEQALTKASPEITN